MPGTVTTKGEPRAIAALQKAGGELARGHPPGRASAKAAKAAAAGCRRRPTALPGHPRRRLRSRLDKHQGLETFPAKDMNYSVDHNYPGWVRWVCKKFKTNPITDVRLGKVFADRRRHAHGPFRVAPEGRRDPSRRPAVQMGRGQEAMGRRKGSIGTFGRSRRKAVPAPIGVER